MTDAVLLSASEDPCMPRILRVRRFDKKCPKWESNPQTTRFELARYANSRHLGVIRLISPEKLAQNFSERRP